MLQVSVEGYDLCRGQSPMYYTCSVNGQYPVL